MSARLPLEGIRVVDLGISVAAPFTTLLLARMGADVILVESRHHLSHRLWPPFADAVPGENRGGIFNLLCAGKRSCTIDLCHPRGRELVRALVEVSDVVVENLSTGAVERLGLDYQALKQARPDLVYLSISAFGRTGPMRHFVGFHSAVMLFSGMAAITGYRGGHPRILGSVFPDPFTGAYGALAVLEALLHRELTGQGAYIDLAMYEAMLTAMPQAVMDYTTNGRQPPRVGNEDPARFPHGVYPCREEDTWVAISVGDPGEWEGLCRVLGRPSWARDPLMATPQARRERAPEVEGAITAWTRRHTPYEAMQALQSAGVPTGPSLDALDVLHDPHLRERGLIALEEHPEVGPRLTVSTPWRIEGLPPRHAPAPLLGQHTREVLGGLLGLTPGELDALEAVGVLY